jgi:hypothetical protein
VPVHIAHRQASRDRKLPLPPGRPQEWRATADRARRRTGRKGPSPLPQRYADPRQAGGQNPRPAPAPPLAGASRPPGRALASFGAGGTGLGGSVPRGRGKRSAFPVPARSGADRQTPNHQRRCHGRGHRPCHSATLTPGPPGAQSPRPAPAPPLAGASRPPGRALVGVVPGPADLRGTVPHGRGNAVRFLFPPGETVVLCMPGCPVTLAGAIAPATAPR